MKMQRSHLWVFGLALGFVVLWCISIGMTVKASADETLSVSAEPMPAHTAMTARSASIVEERLSFDMIGIAGWCLVGVGFFGVAVTVALGAKPKRHKRPVRTPMPRNPARVINTVYSPESRRYSKRVERRR